MQYEVDGHLVDHLPMFLCRSHRSLLSLNVSFVQELLRWGERAPMLNFHDIAAETLEGDEWAYSHSEYLVPPKVILFNPRGIRGHGALPLVTVQVDRRFFGIPASYLRRRIFSDCEECVAENDPSSDHDFPDYQPPEGTPIHGPPPGAPPPAEIKLEGGAGRRPSGGPPRGGPPRRKGPPPPRRGSGGPPGRGGPPRPRSGGPPRGRGRGPRPPRDG